MSVFRSRGATALALVAVVGLVAACGLPRSGPNKREIFSGSVLKQGETLTEFVEATVRNAIAFRRVQVAFHARALAASEA